MDNLKRITGWKLRLLSIVAITTPHITINQLPDITTGLPITLRGLRTIGQRNSKQLAIITIRIKNYNKLLSSIDDSFLINEEIFLFITVLVTNGQLYETRQNFTRPILLILNKQRNTKKSSYKYLYTNYELLYSIHEALKIF